MSGRLVWIDLETTGLNPRRERILEIAIIVTEPDLAEVARYERITEEAGVLVFGDLDPYVQEMHTANGLWGASCAAYRAGGNSIVQVDEQVEAWLRRILELPEVIAHSKDRPKMAGSSVHFDREFIREHMPRTYALFSHRLYDVSSLNEFAARALPLAYEHRPREGGVMHRAMPDIIHSLDVARHYVGRLVDYQRQVELVAEAEQRGYDRCAAQPKKVQ